MSEVAETTAPTSTADIAARTLDSLEGGESTSTETVETPTSETATTETPAAPAPESAAPELSPAAKFLIAQGHKWGKRPDGKTDLAFLPASTVEKMLDRYLTEHKTPWETEKTTLSSERDTLKTQVEQLSALGQLMESDPKAFLELVAQHDERYQSFLTPQQAAAVMTAPAPANDPMPEPNVDLGNGQRTYDLKGLQARDEWLERQFMRKLEGKIDERLKPLTERDKAEKERQSAEEADRALRDRTRTRMQEAQSWPGFGTLPADGSLTEFQSAVLKRLQDDSAAAKTAGRRPTMTLREAYQEERLQRQRADILKEIQGAPRAPTVARNGNEAVNPGPAVHDTRAIAGRVLARLEGAG